MAALYNEIDPYACQWLRNLSAAGHIAQGVVYGLSIKDLEPRDFTRRTQAHFFAGIGVWSHALRLAGWPDDVPVWTGSCPCQPFSAAGKRGGFSDDRHLWPDWFALIRECRPPVVFGEQVASPDGYRWLDLVQADLEGVGYAFGAAVLPAAGVGAPHLRHRIYWVAYAHGGAVGPARGVGHSAGCGRKREWGESAHRKSGQAGQGPTNGFWARADWVPCRDGFSRPVEPGSFPLAHGAPGRVGRLRAYGNAIIAEVAATFIRAVIDSGFILS